MRCLILALLLARASAALIPAASPLVRWQGRPLFNIDGSVSFDWEGTGAYLTVSGNPVSALLMHVNVTLVKSGRVSVFLHSNASSYLVNTLSISGAVSTYLLAASLELASEHTFSVIYGMEPGNSGSGPGQLVTVTGFEVSSDGAFVQAPQLPRRMEVAGDSITAGSQQSREGIICGDWAITNNVAQNYELALARNFSANITTVAWSGRGLIANCGDPNHTLPTVPTLYQWALGGTPNSTWDFSSQTAPDAVIIALGTNDFSCGGVDPAVFSARYVAFMQTIVAAFAASPLSPDGLARKAAGRYRGGPTFFALVGPITDSYANATQAAVAAAVSAGLDAHYVNVMGATLDGCGNHPGFYGHWEMALTAAPIIAQAMGW